MPCASCVQKLALRLVQNHNLEMGRALELARRGMERHERNQRTRPLKTVEHHTDITLDCVGSTVGYPQYCGTQLCYPRFPLGCTILSACTGTCNCPATPDHAHKTSDDCSCDDCCPNYGSGNCPEGCNCQCTGHCYYDCDVGYALNLVTGNCEPVAAKKPIGDGIVFTV